MIETNVIDQTNIVKISSAFTIEECMEISNAILAYKNNPSPSDTVAVNNGVWSGHPHQHNGFPLPLTQLIMSKIKNACNTFYNSMPAPANLTRNNYNKIGPDDWDIMFWAGVGEPGSENREHTHTNSFLSGTIYFQSEGTGKIEFMPYLYVYRTMLPQWPYYGSSFYDPLDGDILIFPSYLLHKVERNPSEFQRINISFNAIPMMGP